jgi:single-strand DNA-binding protein
MAASVNKVILIGNLGADPELRYTPGGTAVVDLRIATNRRYKTRDGDWQEETEWHSVVVWSKQAENCKEYLAKGRTVYIEGRLQTRSWDDQKSGQKRYKTEVVADTVQFLGGKGGGGGGYDSAPPPRADNEAPQDMGDDDIPF